jgi:hypothetical protein
MVLVGFNARKIEGKGREKYLQAQSLLARESQGLGRNGAREFWLCSPAKGKSCKCSLETQKTTTRRLLSKKLTLQCYNSA